MMNFLNKKKSNQACVLDSSLKIKIAAELHNEGHIGCGKTLVLIAKNYFWPTMSHNFYHYIETCHICQVSKGIVLCKLSLL